MAKDLDPTAEDIRNRSDEAAERMVQLWGQALKEIQATVKEAEQELTEGYTVEQLRNLEKEIRSIVQEAGDVMREVLEEDAALEAKLGERDITKMLGGDPSIETFARISRELMEVLRDQMEKSASETERRAWDVGTALTDALRQLQLESLVLSELQGESIEERAARIQKAIDEGKAKIPENWKGSVESYARMVARTNVAEASRNLRMSKAAEYGIKLFQVSIHGATDACGAFEGMLVGEGPGARMSVGDLQAHRPYIFHPNCRHQLLPYSPRIVSDRRRLAAEIAAKAPIPTEDKLKAMNNAAAKLKREQEAEEDSLIADKEKENERKRTGTKG